MNIDPEWTDVSGHVVKEQSENAEKGNQGSYRPVEGNGASVVALARMSRMRSGRDVGHDQIRLEGTRLGSKTPLFHGSARSALIEIKRSCLPLVIWQAEIRRAWHAR
jgi:hypothetical protein